MPKLSDTQSVLLAHAAQRDTASLYPLPATLKPGARVDKAVAMLVKLGLAEERGGADLASMVREEGDVRIGVYATTAGLADIGISEGAEVSDAAGTPLTADVSPEPPAPPARTGKTQLVLGLLRRDGGATVAELTAATGWLPHSLRAALTGLRKAGHDIVRGKRDDVTCYHLAGVAA